jgi:hypothetical protein
VWHSKMGNHTASVMLLEPLSRRGGDNVRDRKLYTKAPIIRFPFNQTQRLLGACRPGV